MPVEDACGGVCIVVHVEGSSVYLIDVSLHDCLNAKHTSQSILPVVVAKAMPSSIIIIITDQHDSQLSNGVFVVFRMLKYQLCEWEAIITDQQLLEMPRG